MSVVRSIYREFRITGIEFILRQNDEEDWTADDIVNERLSYFPLGQENYEIYSRPAGESDRVILNNQFACVTYIGSSYDSIWGYTVNLLLQNKTESQMMFSIDTAYLNGFEADPYWAEEVDGGKYSITAIHWSDKTLESNDLTIEEIKEIEMSLTLYDDENWMDGDYYSGNIIIVP